MPPISLGSSILPCLRALNTTICSRSAANWAGEKPSPLGGACADGGFSGACTTGAWPRTAAAQLAGNIRACSSTAASESRRGRQTQGGGRQPWRQQRQTHHATRQAVWRRLALLHRSMVCLAGCPGHLLPWRLLGGGAGSSNVCHTWRWPFGAVIRPQCASALLSV